MESKDEVPAVSPKLLVVENNPAILALVRLMLKRRYEVVGVVDMEGALSAAREERFDAVILDLNLGKSYSGIDVMHELRGLAGHERIPCVAMTAYASFGNRATFLSQGFDACLFKPFTKDELAQTIEEVLN